MKEYRDIAVEAALAAGKIIRENLGRKLKVGYKGKFNLITEVDHLAEETIVGIIHGQCPRHQIIAEEGHGKGKIAGIRWYVDPLDGTTNYAHGFPFFCVSIGLQVRGQVVLGVVYDPLQEEIFLAERGRGAFLNNRPLSVSRAGKLMDSLVVTGFNWQSLRENLRHFVNFSHRAQAVRRTGSAALDLCYVAMGRFEGYWELNLSPWDMAAGSLMVTEAGGRVTNFRGGRFSIHSREILATNGLVHNEMVAVLKLAKGRKNGLAGG
ncbi:MAG: inositol monophosphatase family protein [Nitrospiria bacterium]